MACYLWPKGEVKIPVQDIESVAVIRKGIGWRASDVLVIKTKTGRDLVSTAPVPDPEALPDRIREAIGMKTSKVDNK